MGPPYYDDVGSSDRHWMSLQNVQHSEKQHLSIMAEPILICFVCIALTADKRRATDLDPLLATKVFLPWIGKESVRELQDFLM